VSPKRADIPEECFDCPLPDCNENDPRCPLYKGRKKSPPVSRTTPEYYRAHYAKYGKAWRAENVRVVLHGVKIRKKDLRVLRAVSEAEGLTFEGELVTLLEQMAENARARGWS
jgi:hypothetical protein